MPTTSSFAALAAGAPLAIDRSACLRLRTHLARCRACADACPVQALRAGTQSLVLGPGCTGCGRCQAACPNAALAVAGFDVRFAAAPQFDAELTIDCARVPAERGDDAVLRVPCLGGLSHAALIECCVAAGEQAVVLADRGLCAQCDSGGADHPARATVQQVAALMREAGVPEPKLPRIEARARRGVAGGRAGVDPMQAHGRARRGFFGAMAKPAAAPRDAAPATSRPSSERQRLIAGLRSLVARHGGRMPSGLFHALQAGPDCRGHRVCASACPTGALLRYRDDGAARLGIAFDAADCIGCGHCVAVCPEQALQLRLGTGRTSPGRQLLSEFTQRECADCGSRFALQSGEDETRCGRCRKSQQLARAAFQSLFAARP